MVDNQQKSQKIYRICLTGGPCGGKTSAMDKLKIYLESKNFKVFIVPEVPTLTMQGGGMIIMGGLTQDKVCKFQSLLMKAVIDLEDYFYNLAVLNGKDAVILYDRGVMDPKAYMDDVTYQAVLDLNGFNTVYLRDGRYDAIIHLVTAADGAEKYYTLDNCVARSETPELARLLDLNTQKAWLGHPHQIIIDNSGNGFEDKMDKVKRAVDKFIGGPVSQQFFRKYLVKQVTLPEKLDHATFGVEEQYLVPNEKNEFELLRKSGINQANSYKHIVREKCNDKSKRIQYINFISATDYLDLSKNRRNQQLEILQKKRTYFIYERQSFVLETVQKKNSDQVTTFLRFEVNSENPTINYPPFITLDKEVLGDPNFQGLKIASSTQNNEQGQQQQQ